MLKVENERQDAFYLNTKHNYVYKLIYTRG